MPTEWCGPRKGEARQGNSVRKGLEVREAGALVELKAMPSGLKA